MCVCAHVCVTHKEECINKRSASDGMQEGIEKGKVKAIGSVSKHARRLFQFCPTHTHTHTHTDGIITAQPGVIYF